MDRIIYRIEESQDGKVAIAFCPELVMTGFGDSSEKARDALKAEISAYLEDCEELSVLDEVLIDAGFYDNDEVWMSSLVTPPKEPKITII